MDSLARKLDRKAEPVWRMTQDAEAAFSDDFYPHIQRILSGELQNGRSGRFIGSSPWRLTDNAVAVLSGAFGKTGLGMVVELSSAAARRLGDPARSHINLLIESGHLHLFGTGIGCVVLCVRYLVPENGELGIEILLEGNYACCRAGARAKGGSPIAWAVGEELNDVSRVTPQLTTLDTIVLALCPFVDREEKGLLTIPSLSWNRIFVYTVVELKTAIQDSRARTTLAFRLSRKYTDDYRPTDAAIQRQVFAPFEYLTHAMSLEGGCTLVEMQYTTDGKGEQSPLPFLREFSSNARKTYWPLALLAYQEFEALLWITQGSGRTVNFENPRRADLDWLRVHQRTLLYFRQNFRFSSVSRTSMHNRVYEMWRDAMMLDKLLAEATEDSSEISHYLNRRADENMVRLNIRQTAMGMFVGGALLFAGLLGMNLKEIQELSLRSWETWLVAGGITLVAYFLGYRRYRKAAEDGLDGTQHPPRD
jgi:hypothetical protein